MLASGFAAVNVEHTVRANDRVRIARTRKWLRALFEIALVLVRLDQVARPAS